MQYYYLFLVLAIGAVSSEVIDINNVTDAIFARSNEILREHGATYARLPPGYFGRNFSFSDSLLLGIDSLERTDNCTLTTDDDNNNTSFEFHYGWSLLQRSFKQLRINGEVMSGGFRVGDNSVRLAFTIHNDTSCYVTLDDLRYERLAKVEVFASRPEYDGVDVDAEFEEEVLPLLNRQIDRAGIQHGLQALCRRPHPPPPEKLVENLPMVHVSVVKSLMNVN